MDKQNKYIGWFSSICFMFSGAPAAIEAVKTGTSTLNTGTLSLWTLGELAAIYYILPIKDKPLLANYFINLAFLSIIWYYKFRT